MSKHTKLEDVKARLARCLKNSGIQVEKGDIRLWKLNYKYDRDDLVKLMNEKILDYVENPPVSSTIGINSADLGDPVESGQSGDIEMGDAEKPEEENKAEPLEEDAKEETNTGIEFPGTSLESMLTFKMDDVEISS